MNCQDRAFILFSQIIGIAHHPRAVEQAKQKGRELVSLTDASRATADGMIEFRRMFGACDDPNCRACKPPPPERLPAGRPHP
jgi:hypothetical protein